MTAVSSETNITTDPIQCSVLATLVLHTLRDSSLIVVLLGDGTTIREEVSYQ